MGLIAQELEQVLPKTARDIVYPAEYDSLGNEIAAQIELKGVNYAQLIPLLIAGFKQQQVEMVQKDETITKLTERLEELELCVREANLCGATPQNRMSGEEDPMDKAVELKNLKVIWSSNRHEKNGKAITQGNLLGLF